MKIREATVEDVGDIQELNHALYLETREKHDDTFNPEWAKSEETKEQYESDIESDDHIVLVSEDEGKLIGFLSGKMKKKPSHRTGVTLAKVDHLFVDMEHRGKGVGKALMKEFEVWAKGKGASRALLYSMKKNQPANDFYTSRGFEESETLFEKEL